MLKIHFSRLQKNTPQSRCRNRAHPRHGSYGKLPTSTKKLARVWAGISISKNRTNLIYSTSLSVCHLSGKKKKGKKVSRGILVAYKRANAIMVSLLMCVAPAGFDLAVLWGQPSSVVSSHASQSRSLTEKRALAVTSGVPEASSSCWWVSRMQQEGGGLHHPLLFRIWIFTTTFSHSFWFFTLFTNVARRNWPAWPRADATPQTWEVREDFKIYTHQHTHTYTHTWTAEEIKKRRERESTKQTEKEKLAWK